MLVLGACDCFATHSMNSMLGACLRATQHSSSKPTGSGACDCWCRPMRLCKQTCLAHFYPHQVHMGVDASSTAGPEPYCMCAVVCCCN